MFKMSTSTSARIIFSRNGRLEPFPAASIKAFLLASPQSVYTTMRCSNDHRIFDLPMHITRIHQGLTTFPSTTSPSSFTFDSISSQVNQNLRVVAAEIPGPSRLTVVAQVDPRGGADVHCCGEAMPVSSRNGAAVVVRAFVRENPGVKSTGFVKQREGLVLAQGRCEETLLANGDEVMEGCSSNFFAVVRKEDGTGGMRRVLRTAKEGVLLGTMRKLVVDLAHGLGDELEVEESPPRLSEMQAWEGCFITSTSRLLLPVTKVLVPKGGPGDVAGLVEVTGTVADEKSFDVVSFERSELITKLQGMVDAGVLARSTKIL